MIRLIRFLWSGCFHVWEGQQEGRYEFGEESGFGVYAQCKKCGTYKFFKRARMKEDTPNDQ